jgi:tRNA(Ile)-lysidine synthase
MSLVDSRHPPASAAFLDGLAAALPPDGLWTAPVVCGVSGGADSVALLLGLRHLAPAAASSRLIVAHARHDMRETADDDARFVAALAGRLGLPFTTRSLAVREDSEGRGEGLEGRARRLRYEFFENVAREAGARHVVVAHTADDQAETILHRALRGTGLAGLSGMAAARELCEGVALLRPLLQIRRADVRNFLAEMGESWCEDETNSDPKHARNFLRHEILPRVEAGHYPAASASLERLARQASRTARALADAADHLLEVHSERHPDGRVVVRAMVLATLEPYLLAEIFVALWKREGWPRRDMTARHYEQLADTLRSAAHDTARRPALDLPGGVGARVTGAGLVELHRT